MFIDHARITVRGGQGGNGCRSFRREKYVAMGGPDGGNGGRGGDVFLRSNPHIKSLLDLTYRPHFYADPGKPGQGSNKMGRGGEDLYVDVPVGTMVYRAGTLIADLKKTGEVFLAAKGGRGGRGNAAFKTQTNTAPEISEKGEPGEECVLDVELKLLADIGLVGCPNAGKSTLLAALTQARPKIADYPFTTLNPNLGVADYQGMRFVIADIPGLIEGAHSGKGLGYDFLRHIERTRLLFHIVDPYGFDRQSPVDTVKMINAELAQHSKVLAKKPMVLVINKMDLSDTEVTFKTLEKKYKKLKIFPISAVTGKGLKPLLAYAAKELAKPMVEEKIPEVPMRFVIEAEFQVSQDEQGVFLITGKKVERLAAMTHFDQEEGFKRFQNILKKMGVEKELTRRGIHPGDAVRIGKIEFEYQP